MSIKTSNISMTNYLAKPWPEKLVKESLFQCWMLNMGMGQAFLLAAIHKPVDTIDQEPF